MSRVLHFPFSFWLAQKESSDISQPHIEAADLGTLLSDHYVIVDNHGPIFSTSQFSPMTLWVLPSNETLGLFFLMIIICHSFLPLCGAILSCLLHSGEFISSFYCYPNVIFSHPLSLKWKILPWSSQKSGFVCVFSTLVFVKSSQSLKLNFSFLPFYFWVIFLHFASPTPPKEWLSCVPHATLLLKLRQ